VLDGSTEAIYERPLTAGDVLTFVDKVVDVQLKDSKSLGTMVIVSSEATGRDRDGQVVVRERSQYIFY
jgi:hypothetical protein